MQNIWDWWRCLENLWIKNCKAMRAGRNAVWYQVSGHAHHGHGHEKGGGELSEFTNSIMKSRARRVAFSAVGPTSHLTSWFRWLWAVDPIPAWPSSPPGWRAGARCVSSCSTQEMRREKWRERHCGITSISVTCTSEHWVTSRLY